MKKLSFIFSVLALAACAHTPSAEPGAPVAVSHQTKVKTDLYFEGAQWTVAGPSLHADAKCATRPEQFKKQDWKSLVDMANACVRAGNWSAVESVANELARFEVNAPWGVYYLSLAAEQRKDFPRALWMIDAAIQKTSSDAAIFHFQKGRILWSTQKYELGLNEVQVAVKLDSHLLEAQLFLADIAFHDLDFKKAKEFYSAALDLDNRNEHAQKGLSNSRLALGESAPQADPRVPAAVPTKEGSK